MGAKKTSTQDCPFRGADADGGARKTAQGADVKAHSHTGILSQNRGEKWEHAEEPLPTVKFVGWGPLWENYVCNMYTRSGGRPPMYEEEPRVENVCSSCNPGARSKEELVDVDPDIPSIYVGETSRTVQERTLEHWRAARGSRKEKEGRSRVAEWRRRVRADKELEKKARDGTLQVH